MEYVFRGQDHSTKSQLARNTSDAWAVSVGADAALGSL